MGTFMDLVQSRDVHMFSSIDWLDTVQARECVDIPVDIMEPVRDGAQNSHIRFSAYTRGLRIWRENA
jgi:hypothetical protein